MKTRGDRIDVTRIGLVGHSEGGLIAPMVAVRDRDIRFVVLLAGPAQPSDELLLEQIRRVGRTEGAPEAAIEANVALSRRGFELIKTNQDLAAHRDELGEAAFRQLSTPWFRYFVAYEPMPVLSRVSCPLLAIGGNLDVQVPSDLNLPLIRQAMTVAKNERSEVIEVEGMNHLMQRAKTGAVSEYATLEKALMPVVPERVSRFILAL